LVSFRAAGIHSCCPFSITILLQHVFSRNFTLGMALWKKFQWCNNIYMCMAGQK
jgi:hypothetical protein